MPVNVWFNVPDLRIRVMTEIRLGRLVIVSETGLWKGRDAVWPLLAR
jgi:hypothetical protein